ncbi:Isotrichodermin C-15 hydroxylase [Cytospora mali]|uniref:Isotrichodermin C-15 hydroxylase n=1 Tax=Cytospora mali TaxID=578113 RepID=A0A194W9P4_CYTMA|nr:Isotrichodermin C-15 hydroxylase [Valsa mali]
MEYGQILSHMAKTGLVSNSIVAKLIGSCLLLITARLIYNVYFHPLARYPGPLYLISFDVPLAILSLLGISQYPLKAAHDKYGDVVRIAPGTLSYIKPEAWTEIYGYKKGGGGIANFPKDPAFYNEMMLGKETITLASDKDAIPIRRSLNAAFAHRSLLEQEPMLQEHVSRLMEQFEKQSIGGNPVDVRKWFTFSMFDINSDFAFGEDMGCVTTGVYHDWVKFVIDYFYAATLLHQCHKFWPLNRLLAFCIPPSTRKMQSSHTEASLRRVRKRMAQETDRHDFMHFFLRQAEKEQLPTKTIEAQATVVILAGSETSSVAETAAVYFMLTHPHIYEKLRADVRAAFDHVEEIKLQDVLSKLPYLDAVVQETLRIHAPLANGFTRYVPDKDGAMICGEHVPQGTVITINHYCSNTSASNFRDPFSFVPERWLGDAAYADDKRDVVQPFSVGPRNCPGQQ